MRPRSSLITAAKTPKGAEFKDVPDVAVVYLADYDPVGEGRLAYSYRMREDATLELGDFGERYVLVNGRLRDGSGLSKIMEVLCGRGEVDFTACPRLSGRVEFIRDSEEAQLDMAETAQEMFDRILEKAINERVAVEIPQRVEEEVAQKTEQLREQSRQEGRLEGRLEGRQEERAAMLADLVAAGFLTPDEAAEWAAKYAPAPASEADGASSPVIGGAPGSDER